MARLRNPALAEVLRRRAQACGYRGVTGQSRIAEAVSQRGGFVPPLSAGIVRAYLLGARTPPHATLDVLLAVLGCTDDERRAALAAADAHQRELRRRRAVGASDAMVAR